MALKMNEKLVSSGKKKRSVIGYGVKEKSITHRQTETEAEKHKKTDRQKGKGVNKVQDTMQKLNNKEENKLDETE